MKTLFSINKAGDLLERDRATLVRHVKPDGTERGQARYSMQTDLGRTRHASRAQHWCHRK
jgi:hypothetical protein